jgi:hypothetical protein
MNVTATTVAGEIYASKAALRRALAADPSDVLFTQTSAFATTDLTFRASEMPFGVRLDIVGPSAYVRKYYANAVRVTSRIPDGEAKIRLT